MVLDSLVTRYQGFTETVVCDVFYACLAAANLVTNTLHYYSKHAHPFVALLLRPPALTRRVRTQRPAAMSYPS